MHVYCTNCGVKLTENSRFCHDCGTPVLVSVTEEPPTAVSVVQETELPEPELPQPTSSDYKPQAPFDSSLSSRESRKGSYFVRHWRGELSLPVSYWINGSLVTIGFSLVLTIVPWDDFISKSPKMYSTTAVGIWVLLALATVWQYVGIWRSANNYLREKREKLWGRLAKILVVVGLIGAISQFATVGIPQIGEYAKIATGKDPLGTYQLRVLRDATELEVAGAIVFGLTDDVSRILDAHPTIHIVHLNSQGGRVTEARNLRDLLTAARGLTTYTASGCFSACVIPYVAGKQRLIAKDGRLGFHQYSFPGMKQQDFQLEYENDKRDWMARGIKHAFVNRAFETPSNDMWEPSHQELYEAGVITGYPDTNDVAVTGLRLDDWEKFESEILKEPLFATLKTYEPKIYHQWVSELRLGLQQGRSQAELRNKIFPLALSIYKQRLPYASDSVVRSVASLLLEQMKFLYSVEPALCYDYLFSEESHGFDATKYFSQEMIKKDSSIMAEVIRSAAGQKNRPPKEEQIQEQLKNVMAVLAQRYGDEVKMLANPKQGKANKAKMCQLTYDAYDAIMRLPERESGPLLRFMFASAK